MATKTPIPRPTAKSISSYAKKNATLTAKAQGMGGGHQHHAMSETVREAEYNGHHIVIRTTYQLEVDGKPIMGHLGVTNDGQVHYHPIPNMSFASAVDLVKQLIDVFPDDFVKSDPGANHSHQRPMSDPKQKPSRPALENRKKDRIGGKAE